MKTLPTRGQVAVAAAVACVAVGLAVRSSAQPLAAHVLDLMVGAAAVAVGARALVGQLYARRAVLSFLIICGVGLSHFAYAGPAFTVYEILVLTTALAFDRVAWWKGLALAAGARGLGLAAFYLLV